MFIQSTNTSVERRSTVERLDPPEVKKILRESQRSPSEDRHCTAGGNVQSRSLTTPAAPALMEND